MNELDVLKRELNDRLHSWITQYNLLHDDTSLAALGRRISLSDCIIDIAYTLGILDKVSLNNGYYSVISE